VRLLRVEAGDLDHKVQGLEAAVGGVKELELLQNASRILLNYVLTWEPGKSVPSYAVGSNHVTDGVDHSMQQVYLEEEAWPPELPALGEGAGSPSEEERMRVKQLEGQVLKMQSMRAELQELESQLKSTVLRLKATLAKLEPSFTEHQKEAQRLQLELASLEQAIERGFPQGWFRIRKLDLLGSRGSEVATLREQLLANLRNPTKRDRFIQFRKRGIVNGEKFDRDGQLLDGVLEELGNSSEGLDAFWERLKSLARGARVAWQASFEASMGPDRRCSEPGPDFEEAEKALGEQGDSLFDAWLLRSPLSFNEQLLEQYLNWAEDVNGAVRVYIKVTNREFVTDGRIASNSLLACANPASDGNNYIPDRMLRMFPCDQVPLHYPLQLSCEDLTNPDFKAGEVNKYGPYFGIFASGDSPGTLDMERDNPKNGEDLYKSKFDWAPGIESVFQQVKSGYTVVLFGYGYSGSGKTYTLLGNEMSLGVVTIGLQDLGASIESVKVRFKELYGRMKLEDGRPYSGETGIYSYELIDEMGELKTIPCAESSSLRCAPTRFWGRHPTAGTSPEEGQDESPGGFAEFMESDSARVPGEKIAQLLERAFVVITNTRMHAPCRTSRLACPRVKATPNNPESSRGHLFTILDVTIKDVSTKGTIVVVDMAGAENPLAIAKSYVDYSVLGWSKEHINDYVSRKLTTFDKRFLTKYKLWETISNSDQTKSLNLANAEAFIGPVRAADLRKLHKHNADEEILKVWVKEYIEPMLIPMVQEGVFVNEALNHLRQFLLLRGGKIESPTTGVEFMTWETDGKNDMVYTPHDFILPSESVRVRSRTSATFSTISNTDRVALVRSGWCVVDWQSTCASYAVDGFALDPKTGLVVHGKLSLQDLERGEVSKIDPMLMLSMLNYFDHPEFFKRPVGRPDLSKLPTKFILMAAVRREHPLQRSSASGESEKLSESQYREFKRNICRGTEATLKFANALNPLAHDGHGG